jgi:hypothetical protein
MANVNDLSGRRGEGKICRKLLRLISPGEQNYGDIKQRSAASHNSVVPADCYRNFVTGPLQQLRTLVKLFRVIAN